MTIVERGSTAGGTQRRAPTYQVLVEDIKAMGVEQVFGLMSDDTAVFATALDSSGIRFYGARHENNAIAMAEGYAYREIARALELNEASLGVFLARARRAFRTRMEKGGGPGDAP